MSRLRFHAYSGASILAMVPGTLPAALGELTDAFEKHAYVELYGTGTGDFVIPIDSAQAAWVEYGNWIGVQRSFDVEPFFLFLLEERDDVFVSSEEQGGEYLHRGGRGQVVVLEWARLAHYWSSGGTSLVNSDEGWWDFPVAATPGQVLKTAIDDVQARTPAAIPFVGYSFSNSLDSSGAAWVAPAGEPHAPIGASLLQLLDAQVEREIEAHMEPDFTLGLYGLYQRNKTATVVFRKGFNIREAAHIDGQYGTGSRAFVRGSNAAGEHVYTEVTDAETAGLELAASGVGRRELFVEHGSFSLAADLTAAGQQELKASRVRAEGEITIGVTHGTTGTDGGAPAAQHMEPFVDYRVGDLITLDIPGAHDNTQHRISGIHLKETDGEDEEPDLADPDGLLGGYEVVLELDGQPYRSSRFDPADRPGAAAPGGGGGVIPDAVISESPLASITAWHLREGDAAWAADLVDPHFESTPGHGVGAGIAEEYDESFAVCYPDNDAYRGVTLGYGQIVVDLSAEAEPTLPLGIRVTLDWAKPAHSLLLLDGIIGTQGQNDGAAMLGTPGSYAVRALAPGALDAGDILAGSGVGTIGGADSGSTDIIVPVSHVLFGSSTGCRLVIVPLFTTTWPGFACAADIDAARAGVESFIEVDATAFVREATAPGWVSNALIGTRDGANTDFTFKGSVEEVSDLFVNGVSQPASAWSFDDATSTLTTIGWAPIATDVLEARYRVT